MPNLKMSHGWFTTCEKLQQWTSQMLLDDWRRKAMGPAIRRQRRPLACWRYSRIRSRVSLGRALLRSMEGQDQEWRKSPTYIYKEVTTKVEEVMFQFPGLKCHNVLGVLDIFMILK